MHSMTQTPLLCAPNTQRKRIGLLLASMALAAAGLTPNAAAAQAAPTTQTGQTTSKAPSGAWPNKGLPAHGLQLAQRLEPTSLADNSARQKLLNALTAMLGNHPEIQQANANLLAAGYDVDTARSVRWPSFKVGTDSGSIDTSRGKENYNTINAEVRLNLLDAGSMSAGVKSAQSFEQAQTQVVQGTRENILLEALTALLELQRYEQKARISQESARIVGQLASIEERRAELGAVGRNDLRQAASRQASARAQQLSQEAQRQEAQARFVRYYRFTPSAQWLPSLEVPQDWLPANENAASEAALANSTEMHELDGLIAQANAEIERSKADRFPTVQAVVNHTYDPKGVVYNDGTRMGVELNWDFGNGFELQDRVRKAVSQLQAQQAKQDSIRRQVQESASASWSRVQAGQARTAELAQAVEDARAAFDGRRRLLEAGRGNLSQVLDAQLDMQNLLQEHTDAVYDLKIAQLQLVRTTGTLLPLNTDSAWLGLLFPPQSPAPFLASKSTVQAQRAPAQKAMPHALALSSQSAGNTAAPPVQVTRLQTDKSLQSLHQHPLTARASWW